MMQSKDLLKKYFMIGFNYHLSVTNLLKTGSPSEMDDLEFQNNLSDINLLAKEYAKVTEEVVTHLRKLQVLTNEDLAYLEEFYKEINKK